MRGLAEFVGTVTAAAAVCGILGELMPKGPSRQILKLTGALFLAFSMLQPLSQLKLPALQEVTDRLRTEGSLAADLGEEMASQEQIRCITQSLQTYILDKAEALGLTLTVELNLEEESYLPCQVVLSGEAAPLAKQRLTEQLVQELGIAKEEILWIGRE